MPGKGQRKPAKVTNANECWLVVSMELPGPSSAWIVIELLKYRISSIQPSIKSSSNIVENVGPKVAEEIRVWERKCFQPTVDWRRPWSYRVPTMLEMFSTRDTSNFFDPTKDQECFKWWGECRARDRQRRQETRCQLGGNRGTEYIIDLLFCRAVYTVYIDVEKTHSLIELNPDPYIAENHV